MNSGITLEEIKRLFNYLEENKTNNDLQIIMTTECCHNLYKLFMNFREYQMLLENRIDNALKELKTLHNEDILSDIVRTLEEIGYVEYILKGEENENNKIN